MFKEEQQKAPVFHSIIIPHRDRRRFLHECLFAIRQSAKATGCDDYEVIVVDADRFFPARGKQCRRIPCQLGRNFNKSKLLNVGIDAARGDLLTFLDADVLVGKRWLETAPERFAKPDPPTCLFYRVRHLHLASGGRRVDRAKNPHAVFAALQACWDITSRQHLLDGWFANESLDNAFEAYGCPLAGYHPRNREPVFGNSQFSILRKTLGDLRYNEGFEGTGFEDLWMIRELWWRFGAKYRGEIVTDASRTLLHICHENTMRDGDPWHNPALNRANQRLWESDRRFRYSQGRIYRADQPR